MGRQDGGKDLRGRALKKDISHALLGIVPVDPADQQDDLLPRGAGWVAADRAEVFRFLLAEIIEMMKVSGILKILKKFQLGETLRLPEIISLHGQRIRHKDIGGYWRIC